MKKQLFFKSSNFHLFGNIHLPQEKKRDLGIIFVHPFAEEKVSSHRAFVNLSDQLEENGIASFRFDFMGQGDSEGRFEESTIETRLANLNDAIDCFKSKTGINNIVLLGVRLGAAIALIGADKNPHVQNIALISPVINGEKYIKVVLRTNLTYQMATFKKISKDRKQLIQDLENDKLVNIDGSLLSGSLFKQICEINLLSHPPENLKNILIVNISKNETSFPKDLTNLHQFLNSNNISAELTGANDPPVWKASEIYNMDIDNTATCIINWLSRIYT